MARQTVKNNKKVAEQSTAKENTTTIQIKIGRPVDPKKARRKKYTTMLNPELGKWLKIEALRRGLTAADLLEQIIKDYLKANVEDINVDDVMAAIK